MNSYLFDKTKLIFVFFIYLIGLLNPVLADNSKDYFIFEKLLRSCYEDMQYCDKALFKIHNYQKNAAMNKKYSCQTRLLGLEANLIMAKNFNLKRKEAKSILHAIKKYC